jgi:hypothetical protein
MYVKMLHKKSTDVRENAPQKHRARYATTTAHNNNNNNNNNKTHTTTQQYERNKTCSLFVCGVRETRSMHQM